MEKQFDISLQNRKILRSILSNTPLEILNTVPKGFRNNLWWNIAHVVATQQLLLYSLSNTTMRVEESWVNTFRKGTRPEADARESDVQQVNELLIRTVEWAKEDYNNGIFKSYNEYTTSNKVTLRSVEDAINFNNFHEGLHLGAVLSQMKALGIFRY